jgi:hypothetical protein
MRNTLSESFLGIYYVIANETQQVQGQSRDMALNDVDTIETTVNVLYETISGPVGTEGDWKRFQSLLFPCASLVRIFLSA